MIAELDGILRLKSDIGTFEAGQVPSEDEVAGICPALSIGTKKRFFTPGRFAKLEVNVTGTSNLTEVEVSSYHDNPRSIAH